MERRSHKTVGPGHSSFQRSRWYLTKVKPVWNQEFKGRYLPHGMSQSYWDGLRVKEGIFELPAVTPAGLGHWLLLSHFLLRSQYSGWPKEQPPRSPREAIVRHEPAPTPARATRLPVPRWLLTALGTLRKILQLEARGLWTALRSWCSHTQEYTHTNTRDQIKSWKHGQSSTDSCPF